MNIKTELGKRMLFLDGGLGTLLQQQGLQSGELPETWNLTHPETLIAIHESYLAAGADIISANTFGANRLKYPQNLAEIVTAGVQNAKNALKNSSKAGFVALDIGSTGKLLAPMGTLDFEEAVSIFAEVVALGAAAGADLVLIETMNDSYELKAAVLAAKEACSLPVFATATFDEGGKMLTGCKPTGMVALLEGLGVDALGVNCGLGPKELRSVVEEFLQTASVPVIVTPNAGIPKNVAGEIVFDVAPAEFAAEMQQIANAGAWVLGGCCGTTPAHIAALTAACKNVLPKPILPKTQTLVTSYSQVVDLTARPAMIGERINPTGKPKFKQALRDNNMEYILNEAVAQEAAGADILDVNVGLPEIDEVDMMQRTVVALQEILPLPLQIDTTNPVAMEAALRRYNGKAMVNSVNGKQQSMDEILPLVKKYGGVVVALTLDENGIPETAEGRVAIAERIYAEAQTYGIAKKDVVIDPLTMSLSTNSEAANITLAAVKRIHQMGGCTVLGVSNVSFGLPQRKLVNASFFGMALAAGLSAGIVNPQLPEMVQAYDTFLTLSGQDAQCARFIEKYAGAPAEAGTAVAPAEYSLKECVMKGLKERVAAKTADELERMTAMEVIDTQLVPALDEVGKGFERGTLFLPQLLMSADAAKAGFEVIRAKMEHEGTKQKPKATVVIATVKGDIHDIGKNIVKVLLENYSYDVLDLGKDVEPEAIVEQVVRTKALVCGLSALMTTTVVYMEKTIELLRERAPWCKVMVGGAVLTQEYADQIGADFYGKDAMQSVHYVESMFGNA